MDAFFKFIRLIVTLGVLGGAVYWFAVLEPKKAATRSESAQESTVSPGEYWPVSTPDSAAVLPAPEKKQEKEKSKTMFMCKDANGKMTFSDAGCPSDAVEVVKGKTLKPTNIMPAQEVPSQEIKKHFSCDGRTRCADMTSCEEAKFFLANCPGVQMDGMGEGMGGIGDGVPCEKQLCGDDGKGLSGKSGR